MSAVGRGRGIWRGTGQQPDSIHRPAPDSLQDLAFRLHEDVYFSESDEENESPLKHLDNVEVLSNLSVTAKEFFPRNYTPSDIERFDDSGSGSDRDSTGSRLSGGTSRFNNPTINDATSCAASGITTENNNSELDIVKQLSEMINKLAINPAKFDTLFSSFVDIFQSVIHDEARTRIAVDTVFTHAFTEPNFRYNGARLFNCLNNLFKPKVTAFRKQLIIRCNKELDLMSEYANDDPEKLYGLGLFMTELFVQLELRQGSGEKLPDIGKGLWDVIRKLIVCRTTDSIKCIFQMLKLGGAALEQWDPDTMNVIINSITHLPRTGRMEKSARNLISTIVERRQRKWSDSENFGTNRVLPSRPARSVSYDANEPVFSEPVFFGPDGEMLTPEESLFIQESLMQENEASGYSLEEDGEFLDPEAEEAYDQFLEMLEMEKMHEMQ